MKTRILLPVLSCGALLLAACAATYTVREPAVTALAGTRWTVTRIDGRDTLRDTAPTADFSVDGLVSGNSGCNRYSGPFIQDGTTVNFGELLSSRHDCNDRERQRQEDRMLAIMSKDTTVRREGETLHIRGADGTMTLVHAATAIDAPLTPRTVQYDCQGVPLTVEYGRDRARLSWPNGTDELELHSPDRDRDSEVFSYESAHSELRVGRGVEWGTQNGPPRSCDERGVLPQP